MGLYNLANGKKQFFEDVTQYLLNKDASVMILQKETQTGDQVKKSVNLLTLSDRKLKLLWEGKELSNIIINEDATQLAFLSGKSIWYYKNGNDQPVLLVEEKSRKINKGHAMENLKDFSKDGTGIFIELKEISDLKPDPNAVKVDVWNYMDKVIQSQQLHSLNPSMIDILLGIAGPDKYLAVVKIADGTITRLQQNEEIRLVTNGKTDIGVITSCNGADKYEWKWNPDSRRSFNMVLPNTGERKRLDVNYPFLLSPTGKYLIGSDSFIEGQQDNLLSYNMETGETRNVTQALNSPAGEKVNPLNNILKHRDLRVATWLSNDEGMLVYDKYDIWQIDMKGHKPPVNITNGYGRKNNIVLRISGSQEVYNKTFKGNERLLLSGFDWNTKESGFYRMTLGKKGDPELLSKGAYHFQDFFEYIPPLKARDAEIYIVKRGSASQCPNYHWTKDFKIYTALSDVYPEKGL